MMRHVALHDPIRRSAALVVAISFHVVVLILLTHSAIPKRGATLVEHGNPQAIQLRLFRPLPQPSSAHMAVSAPRGIGPVARIRATPSAHPLIPSTIQQAAAAAPSPTEKHSRNPAVVSTRVTSHKGTIGDGGFQERLRKAQQSYAVHGIPGSSKTFAPGIHLIDPGKQGAGFAMRQAQRLFGIANRHCIDVDVWRHLTPQALSARHISPGDVDQTDEKYQCHRPPGLSF